MVYSRHATERCRQRQIPEAVVDLVMTMGEEFAAGEGCQICALRSKQSKKEFAEEVKVLGFRPQANWPNTYLILSPENVVITAGYRNKRIKTSFKNWK